MQHVGNRVQTWIGGAAYRPRRLAILLVLAALTVAGPYSFSPPAAVAADNVWSVIAGTDIAADVISLNAFLPNSITIHAGDSVVWTAPGVTPHTITFLAGQAPPPLIVPGPAAGELAFGPAFFPIPAGPSVMQATFDGTQPLSTGEISAGQGGEPPAFRVTFTRAGVFDYRCLIHPGMNGTVEVAPAGGALPESPAQARARGQMQAESLTTAVRADIQAARSSRGVAAGATTHTAVAGIANLAGAGSAGGASALRFLPDTITVRRGDLVVWTVADPLEIHTVSFASGGATPPFVDPRPGPAGAGGPPLLVIPAEVAGPAGGAAYTGEGYANSGILGPGGSFVLQIDAPAGSYTYYRVIHGTPEGGMRAQITVVD